MYNKYPYTDFHELNLDWFLKQFKELVTDWEDFHTTITQEWNDYKSGLDQEWSDVQGAWTTLYNYVHDYFDNLDVQEEIDHKLDEMAANGQLGLVVSPFIGPAVTDWLADNITQPTTPVVDESLTISGAAADAKVTGDKLYLKADNTVISLNKYDPSRVIPGYVSYADGTIVTNANFYTSDYIPVNPGERYKIENNGNNQLALYDQNKEYTTGYVNANTFNLTDIPAGSYYVRFTIPAGNLNDAHFYRNNEYVPLHYWDAATSFEQGIIADRTINDPVEYETTVHDAATLIIAINNILITDGYHYTIYLEEGDYILDASAISTLTNPTYGITVPDNVDLIGLGTGARIICDLTGQSASMQTLVSPINIKGNNVLKNLKITANNCRYAVHADNSNQMQNNKQLVENCTFIHQGNSDGGWAYPAAWGAGTSSGAVVDFKECTFIAPFRAFYMHNNTGFDNPSISRFKDCKFLCTDNRMAFSVESMNSGVKDLIVFDGCSFNQELDSRIQNSGVTGNDFTIIGHGCGRIAANFYYTDGSYNIVELTDQMELIYNDTGAAIPALTPMKYDAGITKPMAAADSPDVCIGITLQPINDKSYGMMQFSGYLNVSTVSGVYAIGQKIGIVNGSLAVVSNNDYIGVVTYINTYHNRKYMQFK